MSYPRILCSLLCLTGLLVPSLSGQGRVVAIDSQAKDLKRTAHQLRVSVEQLKNARTALQEATDLARRSQDPSAFSQLSQSWIRLNRTKAPAAIEDLYGWLRSSARDASDLQTYQRCTSGAQSLLRSLAQSDSEQAIVLWRQWPDPPSSLGPDAKRIQEQNDKQFVNQLAMQTTVQNPEQALTLLREQAAQGSDYATNGRLAAQFSQSGNRPEALRIVDQALADFRQHEPDARGLSSYLGFVRMLPNIDPNRYMQALNQLVPSLQKQVTPNAGGTVTIGDQSLQLTPAEAAVVDICRSLMGRPDLTMKTLDAIPGLRNKLDRVGGIDGILNPVRGTQDAVTLSYSLDGRGTSRITSSSGLTSPGADLYQSLRGKLTKDPAFVSQKLAEAATSPDRINELITLATRANLEDPDLASMALDSASQLVMKVEPLQRRSSTIQNLLRTYRNCEGEVSADLLQKGLLVVQQLREEEKDKAAMNPPPTGPAGMRIGASAADQLEMALVAELALDNFDGALRYVRLMPDDMRLQALLRIVQSLSQSY
ncbi:MAG: hypothetical protein LAP85_22760 [Acidobacteriia bacterium]|nr:hypothetical protein [Terriglobia bacterium]